MPEMTGVDFFQLIIDKYPETVRIMMTGYSDTASIIEAINKGKVDYFIAKPWNVDELTQIIEKSLESLRLKAENKALTEERNKLILESTRREKEYERQQKENIISQFEILKNQVNPHFLFNCLNSLASLVHDDPDLAEEFVEKLSEVYRYVLEHRGEEMVNLQDELSFIKDYLFLQKIRFGEALHLRINKDLEKLRGKIPQLSLQILVENAIKHNKASRKEPLKIDIYAENTYLVIRNNYQERLDKVISTGIGLQNLQERYRFISDLKPKFELKPEHYEARIPLIK